MLSAIILPNNQLTVKENPVADGVMFEKVEFSFTEAWNGYTKTAVFEGLNGETVSVLLEVGSPLCEKENCCYIPFEVLTEEGFYLSVFAVSGESRATTTKFFVRVSESGFTEGQAPMEPTPTEYEQIINLINETKAIANSVRADADNGEFNGVKGDKGEKGDSGYSGVFYGTSAPTSENHPLWVNPEGGGTVIDQVYSPTSENPQSGKAIAQALNEIALNTFYPVGSIYISVSSTNPNTLFGGVWEQISNKFLLSCGSGYPAGSEGGSAEVTLTEAQMPRHRHLLYGWNVQIATGTSGQYASTEPVSTNSTGPDRIGYCGNNEPHSNMPPYLAVYMWKRIG